MEYTNRELFKISKTVFAESMLHSQIQAAGSNKAKFIERVNRNEKLILTQSKVLKMLIGLYLVILTTMPILSFMQINIFSGLSNTTWNLFAGGLSISAFLLFQPVLLIIFSVTFTWGLVSEGPYNWINTLPFSRKEISKVGFFTFLRGIDVQVIVLSLVLPVGTAIGINLPWGMGIGVGRSFLIVFVCLIVNFANTIFNISIVVLLGRKMAKVMEGQEENDKLANFIRIGSMIAYLVASMLASFAIQMAITKIPLLYDPANQFMTNYVADIVNKVLCFIPFPLSGGYLLSSLVIGIEKIPLLVIIGSIVGVVLQIGIAFLLLRKSFQTLQGITTIERKTYKKRESKDSIQIEVRVTKPVRAFMKRDLAIITREMQAITFMIIPIMIPISIALMSDMSGELGNTGIPIIALVIVGYATFSTFFSILGTTSIETGGETITSSLPIRVRDQIIAKLPFLFSIVPLMVMLSLLILIGRESFMTILVVTAIQLPAMFIVAVIGLFLKIFLFGKLKYKYVIEEIKVENKELKYVLILVVMFGLAAGFIFSYIVGYWFTLMIEGISLILLFAIFNLMFPRKIKSMAK